MIPAFLVAAVAVLPVEFVIDCSGAPAGPGRPVNPFTLSFRYECWDGEVRGEKLRGTGPTPVLACTALTSEIGDAGWRVEKRGRPGNEEVFIIRGSKDSPIKSVTFKGDVWEPVVTRRLATRPPPGPKK